MKPDERKLIVTGLYTLVFGAILGLASVLLLWNLPSIQQTAQWAEKVSGKAYSTSYYLLMYAFLIPIMGFWAIHRLFSDDKAAYLLSFWGMILSIFGSALPMASIGVSAFAYPAIASSFLSQGLDAARLIQEMFPANAMAFLLFSGLYYLTGIVLLGIVLWKQAGTVLKIASISLILHGVLIILPEYFLVNLLSWLFLLISSALLIIYEQRLPAQQATIPSST